MLGQGMDTVGTHVKVYHRRAAPMGATVTFTAQLTAVHNKRLEFAVKCMMSDAAIGEGPHERAIVDVKQFRQRVEG
jgi:predicted thioesterase